MTPDAKLNWKSRIKKKQAKSEIYVQANVLVIITPVRTYDVKNSPQYHYHSMVHTKGKSKEVLGNGYG